MKIKVFVLSLLLLLFAVGCNDSRIMNNDLIANIAIGQTYSQVVAIMGEYGTDVGCGAIIYEWALSDGNVLRVYFENTSNIEEEYSVSEYTISEYSLCGET